MQTDRMDKEASRKPIGSKHWQGYSWLRRKLVIDDKANPAAPISAELRVLKILVVDDGQLANDGLVRQVRRWGHDARISHNGYEVLQAAASYHPDLILLDIDMPSLNWESVVRQLRLDFPKEVCFLIALTNQTDDQHHQFCGELGVDLVLDKPVDRSMLETLLLLEFSRNN